MQFVRPFRLSRPLLASLLSALLLAGCGIGNDDPEPTHYRLRSVIYSDPSPAGLSEAEQQAYIKAYRFYEYDGNGRVALITTYSGRGSDNTWGSTDDVAQFYSTCVYSGSSPASVVDPQLEYADMLAWPDPRPEPIPPATTKESLLSRWPTENCSFGIGSNQRFDEYRFDQPGADNKWFTADDRRADQFTYVRQSNGSSYTRDPDDSVGPGVANTVREHVYLSDSNGTRYLRQRTDNGSWAYYRYEYDSSGRLSKRSQIDPGTDAQWMTDDDTLTGYVAYTYSGALVSECIHQVSGIIDGTTGARYLTFDGDRLIEEQVATSHGFGSPFCSSSDNTRIVTYQYDVVK